MPVALPNSISRPSRRIPVSHQGKPRPPSLSSLPNILPSFSPLSPTLPRQPTSCCSHAPLSADLQGADLMLPSTTHPSLPHQPTSRCSHAPLSVIPQGADLMLPGCRSGPQALPEFSCGDVLSVSVPGNPAPLAVGVAQMSTAEARASGGRGRLLAVTHVYGDQLWRALGEKRVPNDGFLPHIVLPLG